MLIGVVVVLLLVERIDLIQHEHINIIVLDADPPGVEQVPARQIDNELWELVKSPLYATEVAAGDFIKVLEAEHGTFELVKRGGNVSVQYYLAAEQADSTDSTCQVVEFLERQLRPISGRVDAHTQGLVSCTVPVVASFSVIENIFFGAIEAFPNSQWQYGNVYDPSTGEPIGWWE